MVILAIEDPAGAPAWEGLPDLLDHLFREGVPCLAVTPAGRGSLAGWLERCGCATRLPMQLGAEDGEGDPVATVLLACGRLAIPAAHALVVADGPRGIAAGRAAGAAVAAIAPASGQPALRSAGAAIAVADASELACWDIWDALAAP